MGFITGMADFIKIFLIILFVVIESLALDTVMKESKKLKQAVEFCQYRINNLSERLDDLERSVKDLKNATAAVKEQYNEISEAVKQHDDDAERLLVGMNNIMNYSYDVARMSLDA